MRERFRKQLKNKLKKNQSFSYFNLYSLRKRD